jgi:hypothetical protein
MGTIGSSPMVNAVEDRISERRLADDIVPRCDGQLAGDHGRAAAVSFLDDFHKIAALRGRQPVRPPVVEDQQVGFGDAAEQAGKASFAMGQFQALEEAWHPFVDHGDAVATGLSRQGTAKPGFPDTTRAGDDQIALFGDPLPFRELLVTPQPEA